MKQLVCLLPVLCLFSATALASSDDFKSRIISSTDAMDFSITPSNNRVLKIVNFVQDTDSDRATVVVSKGGADATVLVASLATDQMSAQDKNMRIACDGMTVIKITRPKGGNAFVTYIIVHE